MKKNNTLYALIFAILVLAFNNVTAQRTTGINNANPSTKAALHIKNDGSFKQGIIIPKLSGADTTTLKSPTLTNAEKGLIFFDTTNSVYQYWNGSRWHSLGGNASSTGNYWQTNGNTLVGADTVLTGQFKYIGTNSPFPLILATDGKQRIRISRSGNVAIGKIPSGGIPLQLKSNGTGAVFQIEQQANDQSLFEFRQTPTQNARLQMYDVAGDPTIELNAESGIGSYILSGNFGIGTVTPNTGKLTIANGSDQLPIPSIDLLPTSHTTSRRVALKMDNWLILQDLGGNGTKDFNIYQNSDAAVRFVIDADGDVSIGNTFAPSKFSVGSNNGFRVDAFGNIVRINDVPTSFPITQGAANSVLTNDGAGNLSWNATGGGSGWSLTGNAGTNPATNFIGTTDTRDLAFRTGGVGSAFERMRILSTGNVGIGTNSPNSTLHIRKLGIPTFMIQSEDVATSGTQIARINFADGIIPANPTPQASIVAIRDAAPFGSTDLPTALTFWTAADNTSTPAERVRISNSGNVGIGTNAPASLFSAGATNQFQVNTTGDIVAIKGLTYSWPTVQGAGSLVNDGTGTLTWANGGGSVSGTGTNLTLPLWTGTSTLGLSAINQTAVGTTSSMAIGATASNLAARLYVSANSNNTAIRGEASSGPGATNTGLFGLAGNATTTAIGVLGRATGTSEARGVEANANSTGTNAYGLYATSTGAAINAYAIYANVTAGTNKYAGVFMGGNVGIGTATPSQTLHIASEGLGGTSNMILEGHSTTASRGPGITIRRSKGTITAPLAVDLLDDYLGGITVLGRTASAYNISSSIDFVVDGAVSGTTVPGRIEFSTTALGTSTATERMRITNAGNVGIGTTAPSEKLEVAGNIEIPATNDYKYSTPKTQIVSVNGAAFAISAALSTSSIVMGNTTYGYGVTLTGGTTGTTRRLVAPVNLPDGAIVTKMDAVILDNSATYTQVVYLYRIDDSPNNTPLATINTTNSATAQTLSTTTISNATINNANYSYYLVYQLQENAPTTMALYTVRITYTVANAD